MNADARVLFRIILCVALVISLYGGMTLLTAAMFAKGYTILALISGLVLTTMTATALALFSLAWTMMGDAPDDEFAELVVQPG
jgi:hypothetical protein